MAQLVSGLDAVFRKKSSSWQDTTVPPNLLLHFFGPEEASQTLVPYLDIANQAYHRDSMKGQVADIPNLLFLFQVPATITLTALDLTANQTTRRDSIKGQVADISNFLAVSGIFNPSAGMTRMAVINPVFNKHPTQETTIQRNPVLDIISTTLPTIPTQFLDEQNYKRDTLQGQYGRSGAIVPLGVPPAKNEIYTFVPKPKGAQEPYQFPNRLIIGIPANPPPFVHPQGEDLQWRRPKVQETYTYPNILAITKPVTSPFVHPQSEDLQWKAKPAQEPIVYQNLLLRLAPPVIIQPFVQQQFDHLQFKPHPTQPHFDYPNLLILQITPLPPPVITGLIMPNVVGQILFMALKTLEQAGILVPSKIGYFGTYPITVVWVSAPHDPDAQDTVHHGVVTAQSLAAGLIAKVNQPITLTVLEYPKSVSFP